MRLMTEVVLGLQNTFVYLDDIIVYSTSAKEHIAQLRSLCERLAQYESKINREKCSLGVEELDFLGHHIKKKGFHPLQDRVKVIRQYPPPKKQ